MPGTERAAYEAAARRDGLTGFEFTEVSDEGGMVRTVERSFHLPIYYMEPPNPIALGFDVASEAERLAPAVRAVETGGTVASPRIRLVEDDPSVYSIAVFHPVYRHDAPTRTLQQRRAAWRGVTAEVFRVAPMVERALRTLDSEGLRLVLQDDDGPPEMRLLYESAADTPEPGPAEDLQRTIRFAFADRTWSVNIGASPSYAAGGSASWIVLAAGLSLSALLAVGLGASQTILRLRRQMRAALKLGQYTLMERVGQGAMGVVYKARHAMLRRPTAIKLLPPGKGGAARLARFEREVQMTSRLTHPNTIAIYDYGRTKGGVLYYAMEYVDGISFDELIRTYGPIPASRTVYLLKQVCGALSEAHVAELIHRDVKPQNLMLCVQGGLADFVKVLDFGLVKELSEGGPELSAPDAVMGTPLYLSPEAIRSPNDIDARSDLYAVGAVAYFLVTGTPVFDGESVVDICSHHLYSEPIEPSRRSELPVPRSLERVILRCLAKQPSDRFPSAQALLAEFESLDDVEDWTQQDAQAWWDLHEPGRLQNARKARQGAF